MKGSHIMVRKSPFFMATPEENHRKMMFKTSGWWLYWIVLPNILGIMTIQWRDPYRPTSIMDWEMDFEHCSYDLYVEPDSKRWNLMFKICLTGTPKNWGSCHCPRVIAQSLKFEAPILNKHILVTPFLGWSWGLKFWPIPIGPESDWKRDAAAKIETGFGLPGSLSNSSPRIGYT